MCGLYGCFGNGILKNDLNAFYHLAFLNQLRGMHSTGVARVWKRVNHYTSEIRKDVVCAQEFFGKDDNGKILEDMMPIAVMGHNRHATVGKKDDIAGAHPFENDRFIGFHNGTLRDKKYTDDRKFFTDSESLYADLAEAENPQKILEELDQDSAFALAYFDKHTKRIGFIRNAHRPLYFATNQKRSVVYYSSEREMLTWALDRCNIEYSTFGVDPWRLLETPPHDIGFADKVSQAGNKYRVNTWFITDFKPNPPKKPVIVHNRTSLSYPPSGYRSVLEPLRCKMCDDEVEYANGANGRKREDNPIYVNDFGLTCKDCHAHLFSGSKDERPSEDPSVLVN